MKKSRVLNLKYALLMIPLLSVFLLTLKVNAETYDNTLPFKFSGVDNFNTFLNDDLLDSIDDAGLPVYDENYVLVLRDISYQSANPIGYRFYFDLLPISTFTSYSDDIYNTSVSFSIDSTKTKHRFYVGILFTWNGSELVPYQYGVAGKSTSFTVSYNMFGRAPTSYTTGETGKKPNWTTTYFYPCYFSKNFYFNNNVVLEFTTGSSVSTGHAVGPINNSDLIISENDLPVHKPTFPTINNYSWTTYVTPTIDTTDLQSVLESIWDSILYNFNYLFSNLGGLFENLIDNLENFVDFIVDSLFYVSNNIVSAIQDFATDFYNNMLSLFEPLFEPIFKTGLFFGNLIALGTAPGTDEFSFSYFTQVMLVPDAVNVVELIVANDEFDFIESGKIIVTSFPLIINQLTSVSPSPVFHIPSCYYHGRQIGDFDISFSWFNNYKLYYDIIINGFLIIGYIYWLFVSFSHHMRGSFLPEQSDDAYQRHNIGF